MVPYLFLLVADAIEYILDNIRYRRKSLKLPNGQRINNQILGDNMILFLIEELTNFSRTMNILDTHSMILGTKVN